MLSHFPKISFVFNQFIKHDITQTEKNISPNAFEATSCLSVKFALSIPSSLFQIVTRYAPGFVGKITLSISSFLLQIVTLRPWL